MTLKALLKAKNEQSNALQAHLLHKGIHMQITRLDDLQHMYKSLNPALWTTNGIYGSFVDHCAEEYKCTHCSALHGCYQPKPRKSLQHPEKYQMPPDFTTRGHDSAKTFASLSNKTVLLDEEQLTIHSFPCHLVLVLSLVA